LERESYYIFLIVHAYYMISLNGLNRPSSLCFYAIYKLICNKRMIQAYLLLCFVSLSSMDLRFKLIKVLKM